MIRFIFSLTTFVSLLLFPLSLKAQVQPNDSWISLTTEPIDASVRAKRIDVSHTRGRSKAVRLVVRQGSVIINRVVITYSNGQVFFGDLPKPIALHAGQSTDPIDLRTEERFVDTIEISYTVARREPGPHDIEVQALQSPAGRLAERANKMTPTVALGAPKARGIGGGGVPGGAPVAMQRKEAPPQPPMGRARGLEGLQDKKKASEPAASTPPDQRPYATVDIFFGTNRKQEAYRQKWDKQLATFGSQTDRNLTLGRAVVTVPKERKEKGTIPRPEFDIIIARFSLRNEDLAQDFTIFSVDKLKESDFFNLVQEQRKRSQRFKDQAFIFVHGFNVSFDDALFRAAQISFDLDFDGVPFVFSWPSAAGLTGYIVDRTKAQGAEDALRRFIEMVERESGAKEIHLIAHSMGADPLLAVLRNMAENPKPGVTPGKPRFGQIVLAAPDVTRENFEQSAEKILSLGSGMTLYASSKDWALRVSQELLRGDPPAGWVPESGPLVMRGLDTIDITRASTDFFSLNHSTFADRAQLLADIRGLLLGVRPPSARLKAYKAVAIPSGTYWRFEP